MVIYDSIFGIRFLPEIICTVERIHTSKKIKAEAYKITDLDSDASHQPDKSEHPV